MIERLKNFFFLFLKIREERCDVRTERREKFCYRGHAPTHPKHTHNLFKSFRVKQILPPGLGHLWAESNIQLKCIS